MSPLSENSSGAANRYDIDLFAVAVALVSLVKPKSAILTRKPSSSKTLDYIGNNRRGRVDEQRQTHATQVAMNHALTMQILNALGHLQDLPGKLNIYSRQKSFKLTRISISGTPGFLSCLQSLRVPFSMSGDTRHIAPDPAGS